MSGTIILSRFVEFVGQHGRPFAVDPDEVSVVVVLGRPAGSVNDYCELFFRGGQSHIARGTFQETMEALASLKPELQCDHGQGVVDPIAKS